MKSFNLNVLILSLLFTFNFTVCETKQTAQKPTEIEINSESKITDSGKKTIQPNSGKISPADILEKLNVVKTDNPKITPSELAEVGNDLIKQKGYDFTFYTCSIAEKNNYSLAKQFSDDFTAFKYVFENSKGKKMDFKILSKEWGHPCGCRFNIPVFEVSERTMTISAEGQPYHVKRPKDFYLEEVELVDKKLSKTLKKWFKPLDNVPLGTSKDGTKIYVETGYGTMVDELILEIDETGSFRFVPWNYSDIITKYEQLKDFPKDEKNDYLGYLKFTDGDKEYILKISFPCT